MSLKPKHVKSVFFHEPIGLAWLRD